MGSVGRRSFDCCMPGPQSISQREICRAPLYDTSRSATDYSVVSTVKKYTLESFSECTSVSNVVEIRRKSVPGGWPTAANASSVMLSADVGS